MLWDGRPWATACDDALRVQHAARLDALLSAALTPAAPCPPALPPLPCLRTLQGINYLLRVGTIMVADPSADQLAVHRAQLLPDTAYVYETRHGGGLKITGQRAVANTQVRLCWGGGRAAGRCLCSSGACGGVYPRACRHPPTLPCVCNHQAA